MENLVFLVNFVLESGIISQFVLLLLFFMSISSWSIIFAKFFQIHRSLGQLEKFISFLSTPRSPSHLIQINNKQRKKVYSPFLLKSLQLYLNYSKSNQAIQEGHISEFERIAAIHSLKIKNVYKKGLSFLAITSASAPFIGLFGTVIGIIKTFSEIALQKSTSLAVVAPGIAEALVATGFGIFVAIPALVFYNSFSEKLRKLLENFEIASMEVFNVLKKNQ